MAFTQLLWSILICIYCITSAFVKSTRDDQLSFFFPQKMTLSDSQNSVQTYTSAPCYVLMASSSPRMDATCANANLVIIIIDDCWYYMYCVSLSCTLIVFSVRFSIPMVCHLLKYIFVNSVFFALKSATNSKYREQFFSKYPFA